MRALLPVPLLALAAAAPATAQRWEARGDGFVVRFGADEVLFRPPGVIVAGRTGGPSVTAAFFLWHGAYIYERLDAGKVESGPALDGRGRLVQSGTWVMREGAPPMRYTLTLEAQPGGVVARLETEKSADLKLTQGLWCTLSLDRGAFSGGQRLWARPGMHGRIGKALAGECEALLIELVPGHAVSFAGSGFTPLRSRVGDTTQGFEMCLRPGDFPVGEKAEAVLRVGFEAMPAEFPGEIKPSRQPLSLGRVTPATGRVAQFGKLELTVDLKATWDNPFDPDDVALDAEVVTASGKRYTQPGFFMVDHQRQ
ncbi:MAG: DUF5060 domain-containing protein, partial [Armatimonadota bacterium]|nr:DUF5060 domain-containing protein [Armatimonadota bacterium]